MGGKRLAVLGGPALDIVARVDFFPPPDGNVVAAGVEERPGGNGGNLAVALAHLGHQVHLLGAVGGDEAGRFLLQKLNEAGVSTDACLVHQDERSYRCLIAVAPQGERRIIALPGAQILRSPDELPREALHGLDGLLLATSHAEVALAAIAEVRRRKGALVAYTPGDVRWPEGPKAVLRIAARVDLLIVNRVEAEALTGFGDPHLAMEWLMGRVPGSVAVTLGEKGVLVGKRGRFRQVPAFPVEAVRDTTGAGDAFAAGMFTGMLFRFPGGQAARLGAAVAALKLRRAEGGAQAGLPSLEEALELLQSSAK